MFDFYHGLCTFLQKGQTTLWIGPELCSWTCVNHTGAKSATSLERYWLGQAQLKLIHLFSAKVEADSPLILHKQIKLCQESSESCPFSHLGEFSLYLVTCCSAFEKVCWITAEGVEYLLCWGTYGSLWVGLVFCEWDVCVQGMRAKCGSPMARLADCSLSAVILCWGGTTEVTFTSPVIIRTMMWEH